METRAAAPASSLDFAGLNRLKGAARDRQDGAIRQTAQQFEALFIQMMLKSMREASFKCDLVESGAVETYEQMFDKEVAMAMAKRSALGIADMVADQLQRQQPRPAADILAERAGRDGKPAGFDVAPAQRSLELGGGKPDLSLKRIGGDALPLRGVDLKPLAAPPANP